ncbi:polysaccharide lyase family 7 protein [Pseudonocardia kunmingensis]|uniref:Alginate lyase n=1 Tax=Pseudonocardia kunmingensis TaxID=630975 RepID=A0A543D9D4_9PSEU|nr:polysaccharide lyase family 7 protein [Pseudonocardia kunmingensis]TQM05957.1 alginate lyase [Pseudonocardia kunmingensis]
MAAVIAVVGSALSLNGVLGAPESDAGVDLASDDLAILPPAPTLPVLDAPDDESAEPTEPTPEPTSTEEPAEEGEGEGESSEESEAPAAAALRKASKFAGELIDPSKWYLTLPTGNEGSPDTVEGSELDTYDSEYFTLNDSKDGIVFTANAGGVTTKNSKYPRSELREMDGSEKASWDGRSGTHVMELDQAITKTPSTKPDVIAGQIHGGDDDVMQIHLSGSELTVKYADGKKDVVLDDSYRLGERFRVKIESSDGHVKVWHNGELKADLPIYGAESYFKAGAYVNSNTEKGASSSDEGQVVIYDLKISHSS